MDFDAAFFVSRLRHFFFIENCQSRILHDIAQNDRIAEDPAIRSLLSVMSSRLEALRMDLGEVVPNRNTSCAVPNAVQDSSSERTRQPSLVEYSKIAIVICS